MLLLIVLVFFVICLLIRWICWIVLLSLLLSKMNWRIWILFVSMLLSKLRSLVCLFARRRRVFFLTRLVFIFLMLILWLKIFFGMMRVSFKICILIVSFLCLILMFWVLVWKWGRNFSSLFCLRSTLFFKIWIFLRFCLLMLVIILILIWLSLLLVCVRMVRCWFFILLIWLWLTFKCVFCSRRCVWIFVLSFWIWSGMKVWWCLVMRVFVRFKSVLIIFLVGLLCLVLLIIGCMKMLIWFLWLIWRCKSVWWSLIRICFVRWLLIFWKLMVEVIGRCLKRILIVCDSFIWRLKIKLRVLIMRERSSGVRRSSAARSLINFII